MNLFIYSDMCGISQNVKDDPQKRHTRVSDVKRV